MCCYLVINMRKEIIMSEQEFNSLKNAIIAAKYMLDRMLDNEEKNYIVDSNMLYVSGNLNEAYDLVVWGMDE